MIMKTMPKPLWLGIAIAAVAPQMAAAQTQMTVSEMESALGLDAPKKQRYRAIEIETPGSAMSGDDMAQTADAGSAPQPQMFAVPIEFDMASSRISAKFAPTMSSLVILLRKYGDLGLEIRGHTDSTGNPDNNMLLSERRAQAVRNALMRSGISPARLRAVGYGQTATLDGIDTRDARNRRVEFVRSN